MMELLTFYDTGREFAHGYCEQRLRASKIEPTEVFSHFDKSWEAIRLAQTLGRHYKRNMLPQLDALDVDLARVVAEKFPREGNYRLLAAGATPIQDDIYIDRVIEPICKVGSRASLKFASVEMPIHLTKDHFIIDGHHRWARVMLSDPLMPIHVHRHERTLEEFAL